MEGAVFTSMIIGLLIGSALGGLILWILAKNVGNISNASYGNSFLICLIASSINFLIWYLIGTDALRMGFTGIFIISLIILSAAFISVGKLIWKCEWIQSVKANSIWILIYSILIGYILNNLAL